ncbi:MAG: response regulator [Cyanobacteriota bacterium]
MKSFKGLRILVVEDDRDCAELFKFLFEDAGARVITVEKPGEALALQNSYKPDVLLSNFTPPDLDSYALVKLMKAYEAQRGRNLFAVALTPCVREVNRARILGSGFHTYIPKPINLDLLLAELENLLELEKVSQHKGRHRSQSTTGQCSYERRISDSAQSA